MRRAAAEHLRAADGLGGGGGEVSEGEWAEGGGRAASAVAEDGCATGGLTLPFTWPASEPGGTTAYLQFWISDPGAVAGLAASNGLKGVSP